MPDAIRCWHCDGGRAPRQRAWVVVVSAGLVPGSEHTAHYHPACYRRRSVQLATPLRVERMAA